VNELIPELKGLIDAITGFIVVYTFLTIWRLFSGD